jgi:hypothetical protein
MPYRLRLGALFAAGPAVHEDLLVSVMSGLYVREMAVMPSAPPPTRSARWPRSPCGFRGTSADQGSGGEGELHGILLKSNELM